MKIPFHYIIRSLGQRYWSTGLTVSAFALVVLALIAMLAMIEGVNLTLISSGSPSRLFVINSNATTENQSRLNRNIKRIIGTYSEIKMDQYARPILSEETVNTSYLQFRKKSRIQANFRGVDLYDALRVHNQLRLIDGRFFTPSSDNEIILGKSVFQTLGSVEIGDDIEADDRNWVIVGVFEDSGSPFESEVWTSLTNMQLYFNMESITSIWMLVQDPALTSQLVSKLNNRPTLQVYATSEQAYFAEGAAAAQSFQLLTWSMAVLMAIGAVFSAMNTMYASIADRTGELATLRAIGFTNTSVQSATVLEAVLMALGGGLLAIIVALTLNGITFRTPLTGVGLITFKLTITPILLIYGLVFSALMGVLGGWIPARYAIKTPIVEAINS